jgi:alcohol dehydrogenase class IV
MTTELASGQYQNWHQWQQVRFGHDALGQLAPELTRLGRQRVLIVTTPSVAASPVLTMVQSVVGSSLAGVFTDSSRGAPRETVLAAAELARSTSADVLVSIGGGSVVDTAKGVALCVATGIGVVSDFDRYTVGAQAGTLESPVLASTPMPLIALPTTLSGAEYTGMIAITDTSSGYRHPYRFDVLAPTTVLLDPRLTTATADRLWAGTGVKSMSDAFEQFVAGAAGPALEPQMLRAIDWLSRWLPGSLDGDLDARLRCQVAACPVLAEVARRTTPDGQAGDDLIANTSALAAADRTGSTVQDVVADRFDSLIRTLGLPNRLSGFGLTSTDRDAMAQRVADDFANKQRSARVWTAAEIRDLLEAAA